MKLKFVTTMICLGWPLKLKNSFPRKIKLYSRFKKRSNSFLDKQLLHSLQQHLSKSIENAENKYFFRISGTLNNLNTGTNCYSSLIKTLLNGKKLPCVPPISNTNTYVTDFKEKCQFFNSYFSEQCTILKDISTLPNHSHKKRIVWKHGPS